jgi:hypothetical protein
MTRKAVSDATQAKVLLKSRRRCCLCFWLNGEDEVKKGQLAHLDGDNENATEDNLAFLCLEHHDEYDSIPRLSKGLREQEVRKWREELYKEMEYRFRTIKKHSSAIALVRLVRTFEDENSDYYCAEFRLKNTGEADLRSPVVSIRILDPFYAARPQWDSKLQTHKMSMIESKGDLFEPNGRIASVAPVTILLRGHSVTFFGLSLCLNNRHAGEAHPLHYQIDAEGMDPVIGEIEYRFPREASELTSIGYLIAEGSAVFIRT